MRNICYIALNSIPTNQLLKNTIKLYWNAVIISPPSAIRTTTTTTTLRGQVLPWAGIGMATYIPHSHSQFLENTVLWGMTL